MSSKAASAEPVRRQDHRASLLDALRKLDPRALAKNPVIFVTEAVSAVVTLFFVRDLIAHNGRRFVFRPDRRVAVVHRAVREFRRGGRGGPRQGAGRRAAQDPHRHPGKALIDPDWHRHRSSTRHGAGLKLDDVVLVEAGEIIPGDGEILEGVASVNELAITGEFAPVIREAGGDRSAVTGGTTVLSDYIKVKITAAPGSTFIDRMIALVEGAERQKTPNELALSILLSGLTLIFLIVCVTLWPIAKYSGTELSATVLIALLVCLIPTTIGGLLSAIGIAGMDRLIRFNVSRPPAAPSRPRATSTRCCSTRPARSPSATAWPTEFIPVGGVGEADLASAAPLPRASPTRRRRAARSSRSPEPYGLPEPALDRRHEGGAFRRADPHFRRRLCGRSIRRASIELSVAR